MHVHNIDAKLFGINIYRELGYISGHLLCGSSNYLVGCRFNSNGSQVHVSLSLIEIDIHVNKSCQKTTKFAERQPNLNSNI